MYENTVQSCLVVWQLYKITFAQQLRWHTFFWSLFRQLLRTHTIVVLIVLLMAAIWQ